MNNMRILDCTLRDGGYVNDFAFGRENIRKIILQLQNAGIDIIECGFLEDGTYDCDTSVFTTTQQIAELLPKVRNGKSMFVAMACYGEYSLENLTPCDGKSIEGIRVTFHYNEVDEAIEYCEQIQNLGYKVFVQPVGTSSYTDEKLLSLIKKVNALSPYAFYLVDTLGLMQQTDVMRFFHLIDHNLAEGIRMGFHSHNNLQLSYSNCQLLSSVETDRIISLDSSVYGMGRGAGNLSTELVASYLNEHKKSVYDIVPLLEIVDEIIAPIKKKFEWGYSVPYYLAAINGCHPNYASYLSGKQTLTVKHIGAILRSIEPECRSLFDKSLAERKYREFQNNAVDDTHALEELRKRIEGRNVLLIAPGPSLNAHTAEIEATASRENCVTISVGFVPQFMDTDFVFLSNLKRYNTTFNPQKRPVSLIHTSNIRVKEGPKYIVDYTSLRCGEADAIADNASLMLLNLLLRLNPARVYLAGMDGYSPGESNYFQERLDIEQDSERLALLNAGISKKLGELSRSLPLTFITPTHYVTERQ